MLDLLTVLRIAPGFAALCLYKEIVVQAQEYSAVALTHSPTHPPRSARALLDTPFYSSLPSYSSLLTNSRPYALYPHPLDNTLHSYTRDTPRYTTMGIFKRTTSVRLFPSVDRL